MKRRAGRLLLHDGARGPPSLDDRETTGPDGAHQRVSCRAVGFIKASSTIRAQSNAMLFCVTCFC